ncbi:mitochondrial ribonuclease P protein 1 homolog [Penaeus monodon]|uniref:mitochondrial ribonuclease P protein 1 homolog n=1 Tax=Penaeus monodon TaxID=6687 RepID=UPI0018A75132|nr:mitochondrial ribonuclease P protein 1 homolog [Penaeus monodon]XP_037780672.1 mitochondrial ribonuclease P protein 1 homolog [Penaeus monodon]
MPLLLKIGAATSQTLRSATRQVPVRDFCGLPLLELGQSKGIGILTGIHTSKKCQGQWFCIEAHIHNKSVTKTVVKTAHATSHQLLHNTGQASRQNFYCTKAVVNKNSEETSEAIGRNHSYSSSEGTTAVEVEGVDESKAEFQALVELEVELYRQEGFSVPDVINEEQWKELLTKTSRKGRRKYLAFLWKNQMKRQNLKKKKELMRLKREEEERQKEERKAETREAEEEDDGHIRYGLWLNSIFLYVRDSTINQFYHSRLISAMIHGQPLVLDLDFDAVMSNRERQNCAYQLQMLFGENRVHPDPYNLIFCNAGPESDTLRRLSRYIPVVNRPEFPLTITGESYLDRFPKDKLVYLTPHCREEMTTYDHNAVYIVGGIVDTGENEPVTLAKAKREGIRMQKLPLDRYLEWGIGGKCLTLNQIVSILLDIKHTGDWHYALRHVPRRKLRPALSQEDMEAMLHRRMELDTGKRSPYRTNYAPRMREKKKILERRESHNKHGMKKRL